MVKQAKIEKSFGDRYTFYSKGFYNYEEQVYLGRIWDNELGHWVPEQFSKRHPKRKVSSGIKFDKYCNLRMNDGKWKNLLVSRLIYQAFHPEWNMFKDPYHEHINHKEEDETCNNDLDNLELMTPKQNNNHGTHNQRVGESCRIAMRNTTAFNRSKPVICIETGEFYWSASEAARAIGHSRGGSGNISLCCREIRQSVYGYTWRYASPSEIAEHSK